VINEETKPSLSEVHEVAFLSVMELLPSFSSSLIKLRTKYLSEVHLSSRGESFANREDLGGKYFLLIFSS
jgi:hypothetical protein